MCSSERFFRMLAFMLVALCLGVAARADDQQPNLVIFYVDDMGWQDTSVQFGPQRTQSNDLYRTPNMQRLADGGMKFTRAYATALCTPSRISLMTGQSAMRHGATNWTLYRDTDQTQSHPHLLPPRWPLNGLQPIGAGIDRSVEAPTLAQQLREAGYHTMYVGKAHLGAKGPPDDFASATPGDNPLNLGFDRNVAGHGAGGPGSFLGTQNFSAAFRNGARVWDVPHLDQYHGKDIFLTEALTLEAEKLLDEACTLGKPFFLMLSHYAVHVPFAPDKRFIQRYRDAGLSEPEAQYAAMIEGMDHSLGAILDYLDEHGLTENTLVIFASDNGGVAGHAGLPAGRNAPLRAGKASLYEGGVRIPMIVRWPKKVAAGSTCDVNVMVEDYYPTLLACARASVTADDRTQIDGVDLTPLLTQVGDFDDNRAIYFHLPQQLYRGSDYQPYTAVIRGDWKLIYLYGDGVADGQGPDPRWELYDLSEDLSETQNLIDERNDVAAELSSDLVDAMRRYGALTPVLKRTGEPLPLPDRIKN